MVRFTEDQVRRAARQHAETTQLLGVDFLPVRSGSRSGSDQPEALSTAGDAEHVANMPASHLSASDKPAALNELEQRHARECPHCTQATAHQRLVFGAGNPDAALMFIGEAPGAEEDKQGVPFVGRAGQKLTEMIKAMGLSREDVYITNVLKARPPNNATPTPLEAERCGAYLREQIEIIRPKVIVTLGKPASNYLLQSRDSMTQMRGRWARYMDIPVMPTFHPAYLLRSYTVENRKKVWSDLQKAMEKIQESTT